MVLEILRRAQNIYLIESSSDYKLTTLFASCSINFLFKLTLKTVFHLFQLKFQEHYSRVYGSSESLFQDKFSLTIILLTN